MGSIKEDTPMIWKDIPGLEQQYQASNEGMIRSLDRKVLTKNNRIRSYKGRVLSSAAHSQGYLVVNLRRNHKRGVEYVHRLIASTFLGESSMFINHKDLNKKNNKLNNLEYVSNKENLLHAFRNGVKVGKTILSAEQRKEIRQLRSSGFKLKVLAAMFSVSESAISEVARGTTWSWEKNGNS
jgi:hypothetical protein